MKFRNTGVLAVILTATAALLHAPAGSAEAGDKAGSAATRADKVYSTNSVGKPAGADKVYSTTTLQDPVTEAVRERFVQRFANMPVTAVRRTPYGLFEVQVGMDLIYTDEKVSWVMEGPLIDAMSRHDVTSERREQLGRVPFEQLPLDLAIKHVKGDGSRKVAIFEDPNCGYCKQLRKTLLGVDNLTIYSFVYPILSADSKQKARNVWCAPDRAAAWDDWMLRGKAPAAAAQDCAAPADEVLALGKRLMVRGTPTIFFVNGDRASGALPLDEITARLK